MIFLPGQGVEASTIQAGFRLFLRFCGFQEVRILSKKCCGLGKKEWKQVSCGLMVASFLAVLAAVWGFLVGDIVLASTQWLLVAAVLALFGVYTKMES